ncbi:MAG: class I SAM-dependent rRNA methyltransferase [Myxococcota bacterium]
MQEKNRVIISNKGRDRILRGHRWVYSSEIIKMTEIKSDLVYIFDQKRHFIGSALYSKDSQIALRLIDRDEITDINAHIERSLLLAGEYRERLALSGDCLRIVHSESDNLPGLIVDKYADTIVFMTLTRPMENLKEIIVKKIAEIFNPLQIFEKNDSKTRAIERLPESVKTVHGKERKELFCTENHHIFFVDLYNSQKTSEYLDQKINRAVVGRYARGRVLDLFCYHSWFGCNINNYEEIISVDSSQIALEISERNKALNNKSRFHTVEANVFDYLRGLERRGERFDTIILDPPGFIRSSRDFESGYRGYKEINLRAMKILSKGGILATFSCSYYMSDEDFSRMIRDAATDAGVEFVIKEYLRQSPDHREILGFPESHYLKGFILEKI